MPDSSVSIPDWPSQWMGSWQSALNRWGRYIKLKEPRFIIDSASDKQSGTPLAYIDLQAKQVVVGCSAVERWALQDYAEEIFAHEIGHHVYAPGDLNEAARCMARMRRALREYAAEAGIILNMYTDLMINHRLKTRGLRIDAIYRAMKGGPTDPLWDLYMRTYELLWGLPAGNLGTDNISEEMEADAAVAAQLIRSFANEVVRGSGMFASICYYYLQKSGSAKSRDQMEPWADSEGQFPDGMLPDGLTAMDAGEDEECIYPEFDETGKWVPPSQPSEESAGNSGGQTRLPNEYHAILESMGIRISPEEAAIRYYTERARPHLIPFPVAETIESEEPLLEGYEIWQPGHPVERINWFQSLLRSTEVIPGYTTVQNRYGRSEGQDRGVIPVDLDLYVDCSGSMPNPAVSVSYPALAGAIIALSALRTGSRVQATLWSGPGQYSITDGFVRDQKKILGVLVGYFGGGTAFPLQILRKTYLEDKPPKRKVHILVISDDGVDTILQNDELGNSGADIAARSLDIAGGGGTFALQLYSDWQSNPRLKQTADMGFKIHSVNSADELTAFARRFVIENYAREGDRPGRSHT